MRIAFSGSRRVGKSTLVEAVAERSAGHATVDEGHACPEVPALGDFEAQLERRRAD